MFRIIKKSPHNPTGFLGSYRESYNILYKILHRILNIFAGVAIKNKLTSRERNLSRLEFFKRGNKRSLTKSRILKCAPGRSIPRTPCSLVQCSTTEPVIATAIPPIYVIPLLMYTLADTVQDHIGSYKILAGSYKVLIGFFVYIGS